MSIEKLKYLAKQSAFVRDWARSRRLSRCHPNWDAAIDADRVAWTDLKNSTVGPRVLFCTSLGSSGYGAVTALEGLLGIALTARRATIEYLLCDGILPACQACESSWYPNEKRFALKGPSRAHCRSCYGPAAAAFSALGLPVHQYSGFLTEGDHRAADSFASGAATGLNPQARFDVHALREHALAGTLRFYARGEMASPLAASVHKRYLKASYLTALVVQRIIEDRGYDVVVTHHGIYVPQGIVAEVARSCGKRVVTWHMAYRKKSFIFSHNDTYHHTMMSEPTGVWEEIPWNESRDKEITDYLKSRAYGTSDWIHFHRKVEDDFAEIQKSLGLRPDLPVVGLLTNVVWDAQLHYPANAFPDMLVWLFETIEYFKKRQDLQLVIRVHPAELRGTVVAMQRVVDEIRNRFPVVPSNVFVVPPDSPISTYALSSRCNAVLIYGTKTGVELASFGTNIIVAGEAWSRNKGFTIDVSSPEEYFSVLDTLPLASGMSEAQVLRARKYAYHFFFRRMIPVDAVNPRTGYPPFDIGLNSVEDVLPGKSVGLDVICDGILTGAPFVFPYELQGSTRSKLIP